MSTLRTAMWPVTQWSNVSKDFAVELREAPLGCLAAMHLSIGAHDSHRAKRDLGLTQEDCFLLLCNQHSAWGSTHNGHAERLLPGDIVMWADSELDCYVPSGLQGVVVRCPVSWLLGWLPDPQLLVGRRIPSDSRWGRVLAPMFAQLTPEFAIAPPLPHAVLVDQVGATLALIAGEAHGRAESELFESILGRIRERCTEAGLTATQVADSLKVPPRLVHRVLAARQLTFAAQLLEARISVALRLLASRSACTQAEIAQRAGFHSEAHFERVIRKRTGHDPLELRRLAH